MPYADKDAKREYDKRYRKSDSAKRYGQSVSRKYRDVKRSAKRRQLEFVWTRAEYEQFFYRQTCTYCGASSSGIDRVDNSKGYVIGNCVACCGECNSVKGTRTFEEFVSHIGRVYRKLSE